MQELRYAWTCQVSQKPEVQVQNLNLYIEVDLQIKYKRRTENNKIPGTSKVLYQPV